MLFQNKTCLYFPYYPLDIIAAILSAYSLHAYQVGQQARNKMNKTQVKKKIMTATKFNHVCNSMLFSKSFNFTLLALDQNIATKKALVNKAEDRKKIET